MYPDQRQSWGGMWSQAGMEFKKRASLPNDQQATELSGSQPDSVGLMVGLSWVWDSF
jgi:hypothetical protein